MAEELIQEHGEEALKNLKKVLASRGKLQANFYFAGDTKGREAGLVVTLTARDTKGSKAASHGKKLRKEIAGAKFARGTVNTKGSKLQFILHSGTASKDHIKIGFKKAFLGDWAKALKAMLRKAIVQLAGKGEKPEAIDEEAETIEDTPTPEITEDTAFAELSIKERAELAELINVQGDLNDRNRELESSFLSTKEADEEYAEQLSEVQDAIASLKSADPVNEEALQQKREELAAISGTGGDPFPESIGAPLDVDTSELLSLAMQNLENAQPAAKPSDVQELQAAVEGYRSAFALVSRQLETLRKALLEDGDEDLIEIAEQGLNSLTADYRTPMEAALVEINTDSLEARQKLGETAAAFAAHLEDDEAVAVTDDNFLGVKVTIASTLIPALRALSAIR